VLKGVKLGGRVAYIISIVSYTLLSIMFIRAVTLPNAWEGIKHFITPDLGAMLHARVWYSAVTQCLFSMNTGFGPLTTLGSFNRFDHNIYKDAWIVSGIDLFTSLFAGVTVFAVLGNLAGTLDVDVREVTYAENELALIVFAQGMTTFTWLPQLFSIVFYPVIFALGVITVTAYVGAVVTVIHDQFPTIPRLYVTSFISVIGFVIGLIFVTPGGSLMVRLTDYYGARMVIFLMTAVEVIGVAWIYGADKFAKDMEFMLGIKLGWYWKFCWRYFIPAGFTVIMVYALAEGLYGPLYKGERITGFAAVLGWTFTLLAVSAVPIGALHSILSVESGGGIKKKLQEAMKPSDEWGPRRSDRRHEWMQFKQKTS
jgi:solute carrier family 6 amino acid transporter-like protein 5/7/9/14